VNRPRLLNAGLLLILTAASSPRAPQQSPNAELATAVSSRHLTEAVRVFGRLTHPSAEDQFLFGYALMELHRPLEADAPLRAAKAASRDGEGWPDVNALLDRVGVFRDLAPPSRTESQPSAIPDIAVYAGPPTEWSTPVLKAVPEFSAVGHRIFGKDLPPMRFYLFADRRIYDRFYSALFTGSHPTAWQDGTGSLGVVTFCEKDREGVTTRSAGLPETVSVVLHEFGHAWIATYLMEHHDKDWIGPSMRRPWLDEGLADFVASLREPAFLDRRVAWLTERVSKGVAAPPFEELETYESFYKKGDIDVHYWLSALFVADLLGANKKAPETLRKLVDEAGRSGDVEAAVATVTGKDLRKEFSRVVRRFW
jgi:hypothetical protein